MNTRSIYKGLLGLAVAGLLSNTAIALPVNAIAPQALIVDIHALQGEFTKPEQIARARSVSIMPDTWTKLADGSSAYDYALTIPGSDALALHFTDTKLPAGTLVTVAPADGQGHVYTARDVPAKGSFTSGFVQGDTLRLHITAMQPADVQLFADMVYVQTTNPVSVSQATDHVHAEYEVRAASATLPTACNQGFNTSCRYALLVNAACSIDASSINVSRAAIALLITNGQDASSCSGTLVNNTASDGHTYIVTAAHCAQATAGAESGPNSAVPNYAGVDISAYYGAIEGSCGTPYYDPSTQSYPYKTTFTSLSVPVQNGITDVAHLADVANPHAASTICKSGSSGSNCLTGADAWLIGSPSAPPLGASPFYSALDASDPTAGDTTVPYNASLVAQGSLPVPYQAAVSVFGDVLDISYAREFPQTFAFATTPVYNGSEQAAVENAPGLPGASGPASWVVDFDQGNNDGSTGEVAPGSSGSGLIDSSGFLRGILSGASSVNADSFYFRFDLAWATFKAFLDPTSTGATRINGFQDASRTDNLSIVFGALQDQNVPANGTVNLRYFVQGSTSCATSSYPTDSGWNGSLFYTDGQFGTAAVTVPGATTLTITCSNAAGFQKSASVNINGGVATDTTPDNFAFTPVTGATPDSLVNSNTVTVTGINQPAAVNIAGGAYSINGGAFTTASGSILPGQTLTLQVQAPADGSTAVAQVVVGGYFSGSSTLGGYTTTFQVTSGTPAGGTTTGSSSGGDSGGTTGSTTGGTVTVGTTGSSSSGSGSGGGGGATSPEMLLVLAALAYAGRFERKSKVKNDERS